MVWVRLPIFLLLLAPVLAHGAESPFNFESTQGKLPKTVVPTHYSIRLEPDLGSMTTHGVATVDLDVRKAVSQIVLNAVELQITNATLAGHEEFHLETESDPQRQTVTLRLPKFVQPGKYVLKLEFNGRITAQCQGLFYVKYAAPSGQKTMLCTQMEPADVRRMFPCWDEPAFRAIYELTVVVPEMHLPVSNMPIASEKQLGNGMKEVRFQATPPMASYLVVFASGEFEQLTGEAEGVKLRVITTEGKREQGRYALEVTKEVLAYYNDYFGIKYPLPKLDQIAVPGGFDWGMENWGGITYGENMLLFDPAKSSEKTRRDIFVTVSHEMSHQWFGDLVTMGWWNDLWLNEGFATWMENKATDHFNPNWEIWLSADRENSGTMDDDAGPNTHPIETEVDDENDAEDVFDDITYQKAGAVLRMLENFLGEAEFRAGIHSYLAGHQYSNTTGADLWLALEKSSGKPISKMTVGWTEQGGIPLVKVQADCIDGQPRVSLSQQRFTVHYPDADPESWSIPVSWADTAHPELESTLLLDDTASNTPHTFAPAACDEVIALNPRGLGYYRVEYDAALFEQLRQRSETLAPATKLKLASDTWALVEAGRMSPTNFFELAGQLKATPTFAVWDEILSVLEAVDNLELDQPGRAALHRWACGLLQPQWQRLGWEPRPNESSGDALLRGRIIGALGNFGDASVITAAREHFDKFLKNPAALPVDLRPSVLNVVGRYSDQKTYDALHELARRALGTEEREMYYHALASAGDPDLARQTLALSLTNETSPQESAGLVPDVAVSGEHLDLAWDFAKRHAKALLAEEDEFNRNYYLSSIVESSVDPGVTGEMEGYVKIYVSDAAISRADETADRVRFRASLRERLVPPIDRWIAAHSEAAKVPGL